jgi:iron complex transport system substrate-binding protein
MNRKTRLLLAPALIAACWLGASAGADQPEPPAPAFRVVSMNPSLTQMLIAFDAEQVLVGVDEFSANLEPAVAELPRVGGFFNPSLEAVVALEPDLVVLVPSVQQRDFQSRLGELGIEVIELASITLEELLESMQILGDRVGRSNEARERVAAIRSTWSEIARESALRPRRSAVLVLQRDPLYLVGGGSYLSSMLNAAGLDNVAAEYSDSYPRVSLEWLIASRPQVIIDSSADPVPAVDHWSRWASIPAVANGRVIGVPQGLVTLPGPYLDRSLRAMVAAIRGADENSNTADGAAPQ